MEMAKATQETLFALKTLHQGYLWPYIIYQPPHKSVTVSSPLPFYKWGLNIVGPLPLIEKNEEYVNHKNYLLHQMGGSSPNPSHYSKRRLEVYKE